MQYVVDNAAINTLNPVDPMRYKPALAAAYNALQGTNAKIKHIILLGDGDVELSYSALVTQIRKAGITISTVATGGGTYGVQADYGTTRESSGNLCIADADNQRAHDVNTSGTMSTVAGTLYAAWPMRGAARVCYTGWCERGPLAAVDAWNRSHREGATPHRMRVSYTAPFP